MRQASLSDLAAFSAVARHRNFRRAAAEAGLSASALSYSIRGLETRLGVRLLNRTTRAVSLTEAGERLLTRLRPALRDVTDALEELNAFRDTPTGTLRISATLSSARLLMQGPVAEFLATYPAMRLDLAINEQPGDIVSGNFDAGVGWGKHVDQDMIAVRFGPVQRVLTVASPAYLRAHGAPEAPADLIGHECVRFRYADGRIPAWTFESGAESVSIDVDGPLVVGDSQLVLEAALGGLGVARALESVVAPYTANNRLVEVMPEWRVSYPGFYLYYPGHRLAPAGLRAFIEILRRTCPEQQDLRERAS